MSDSKVVQFPKEIRDIAVAIEEGLSYTNGHGHVGDSVFYDNAPVGEDVIIATRIYEQQFIEAAALALGNTLPEIQSGDSAIMLTAGMGEGCNVNHSLVRVSDETEWVAGTEVHRELFNDDSCLLAMHAHIAAVINKE